MAQKTQSPNAMPHNLEAEQSLLGCILIDEERQMDMMMGLSDGDFYSESHKLIFAAMSEIAQKNKPIDLVTLCDQLEKSATLEQAGGIAYVTELSAITPSAANYKFYKEIVARDGTLRRLIRGSQSIIENAVTAQDSGRAVAFAEKVVFDISERMDNSTLVELSTCMPEVVGRFDQLARDKDAFKGLLTGYTKLDDITGGLHKGDLVLLAARPAMGKTSLAMNLVENVALRENAVCAVFSLEMPKSQLAQRLLCSASNVSMEKALKGKLDGDEWKRIWAAQDEISKAKIFVDDSSLITPAEMLSKCRRLKSRHGLDFVMVDYIQLMSGGSKKADNRQQEISEISRSLKILAKEIDVPVLALSQLSRSVESRTGHRPQLSDLRESGAIEQDADIVMFIHRPDLAVTEKEMAAEKIQKNMAEIIIAKHRNGRTGSVNLYFKGECTKFINPPRDYPEDPYQKRTPLREEIEDAVSAEFGAPLSDVPPLDDADVPPEEFDYAPDKDELFE